MASYDFSKAFSNRQRVFQLGIIAATILFSVYYLYTKYFGVNQIGHFFEHWGSQYEARYYVLACTTSGCSNYKKYPGTVLVEHFHTTAGKGIFPSRLEVKLRNLQYNGRTYIFSPVCLIQSWYITYSLSNPATCTPFEKGEYITDETGRSMLDESDRISFNIVMTNEHIE
jgi:hypothetical protein